MHGQLIVVHHRATDAVVVVVRERRHLMVRRRGRPCPGQLLLLLLLLVQLLPLLLLEVEQGELQGAGVEARAVGQPAGTLKRATASCSARKILREGRLDVNPQCSNRCRTALWLCMALRDSVHQPRRRRRGP